MRYFGSLLYSTFRLRRAAGAPSSVLSALTASTLLCCAAANVGCVQTSDDATQRAASQRATQQEREKQNRNLIDQVVRATEEQENYPDPTYLRGALSRLNGWLGTLPTFADFEPDAEFARLADETAALAETARQGAKLVALFADENGAPTEKDANELQTIVDKAASATAALAESLDSDALRRFAAFAAELQAKLASAKEFQFADATETFQTQIRQFPHSPFYNFETLAAGLDEFSRLLRLDARSFAPQDADFLKESVWLRDVYGWAKGKDQNDFAVVCSLFDWTVANVVSTPPLETPAGPIAQLPWQTILIGQGTPFDRALVFIELLRQHRIDAFVVRPNGDVPTDFPLVVGVRLDGETYLFLPEYGLPIPAAGADALVLDGGLRFAKIATLAQVAADDAILRRLDLPERPFPATAAQFAETVALVPSTPFLTAERSLAMEREFGGTVSTVLATPFESQKARIAELAGVVRVERLRRANAAILEQIFFPFETETLTRPYSYALAATGNLEVSDGKSDRADSLIADDQKIDASTLADATTESTGDGAKKETVAAPLWKGKILYFKGRFVDEKGAAHWFQQGRVSDRALRQEERQIQAKTETTVAEYVEWARAQGAEPTQEELQAFALQTATALQSELAMKHYVKSASKFYLALLSDAAGHEDAALAHLRDAVQNRANDVWRVGSVYFLARILERRGETSSAVNLLRSTPTDPGRLLRARWLADLAGQTEAAPATENAPLEEAAPATENAPLEEAAQ
ncbi:MAG: hypothetical protein IKU86_00875, partial [Thermoguttaceae bacterium]|nr:hypothetical protein [Thermoguttaceae bacterium]